MESRHCGQDKRILFCPVHNASTPCSLQALGIRCIVQHYCHKISKNVHGQIEFLCNSVPSYMKWLGDIHFLFCITYPNFLWVFDTLSSNSSD